MRSFSIVIPTYNEAENISILIPSLFSMSKSLIDWNMNVVIVDGNSTDNTLTIVENFIRDKYSSLYLIKEKKKNGIGSAYMTGFKFAMDMGTDAVVEFDGDLQHPVSTIPELLNNLDLGYDYVVGSRYVKGGNEGEKRNRLRSILSRFGGNLAKFILFWPFNPYFNITDITSGLKITRVAGVLDKMNLDADHLISRGFGYKLQLFFETLKSGAKYSEIPFYFGERKNGQSKFSMSTITDILKTCFIVRLRSPLF